MRPRSSFIRWGALALLMTIYTQQARAEVPPPPFPRDPAPEAVEIEILRVFKVWRPFASNLHKLGYKVWVVAKVRSVGRTATGLKEGSKITIRYDAHEMALGIIGGPASNMNPSKGDICSADLEASGWAYIPWDEYSISLAAMREK